MFDFLEHTSCFKVHVDLVLLDSCYKIFAPVIDVYEFVFWKLFKQTLPKDLIWKDFVTSIILNPGFEFFKDLFHDS